MGLAILTPLGQRSLQWARRAEEIIQQNGLDLVRTPESQPVPIDHMLYRRGNLLGIAELKSRPKVSLDILRGPFNNEWLVTETKIIDGRKLADMLRVDFVGFLHLVDEDIVLAKMLYSPFTQQTAKHRVARTWTQATINGGSALRDNAYIDMRGARVLYPL